jgi:glycosyltransferase involved in cell wall biosynthesis
VPTVSTTGAEGPLVTLVIPSLNQARFLEVALQSVFAQDVPVEVFVQDGGSCDGSREILARWSPRLAGWRSGPDGGQSAAINQGMALGSAPYVAWLNADDFYLPGGLRRLVDALQSHPEAPMAYGRCPIADEDGNLVGRYPTMRFSPRLFANFCFICQPGTLMRRTAWQAVGGVDESLHMCMDYDLWWRLYRSAGEPAHVSEPVAATRHHDDTKTATRRRDHYREARAVVRRHWGRVPLKWYLAWPYKVWWLERRNARRRAGNLR